MNELILLHIRSVSKPYHCDRLLWQALYVVFILAAIAFGPITCYGSAYDYLRMSIPGTVFAVDPDLIIRKIDPYADDHKWTFAEGWGLPPLVYHTRVKGKFDRVDFFYPLGFREESVFKSRLQFFPFFESRWSKIPPFDGYSRCLTFYQGRSDLGQEYWGAFPFIGHTYRKFGVDHNFFFLFPLYYESTDDGIRTMRFLWPFITYANNPGRQSFKIWPIYGKDAIKNEYFNEFALWPLFQKTEKHPGTAQAETYIACPFPLYSRQQSPYYTTTNILWPLISYSFQYKTGHQTYQFRPFFKYGTGGGVEEYNILYLYSYKKDCRTGKVEKSTDPKVIIGDDEVFTERNFFYISTIQKRYRKGCLVHSRYRFWPFADYQWDAAKGTHLKFPAVVTLRNDFFDLNLGKLFRIIDLRETPFTRELSVLFGLHQETQFKKVPHLPYPPKPGEDSFTELLTGSFGNR